MDWAHDNACLNNEQDLQRFEYRARPAVVIKIVQSNAFKAQKWCLDTDEDWAVWLETQIDPSDSGLVLVLAGETTTKAAANAFSRQVPLSDLLDNGDEDLIYKSGLRRRETLAGLGGKKALETRPGLPAMPGTQQRRSVRQLPFEKCTFKRICKTLQVHRSILRAISRSDIPSFSSERVKMGRPSLIYTCRSSNAWPKDAALSITHYPQNSISFAIFYGCSASHEASIVNRLQFVGMEARHPLLLPGMFAEMELARHKGYTEASINELETKILELDIRNGDSHGFNRDEVEKRNLEKRAAWLDMSYLLNSITTWKLQLERMAMHIDELAHADMIQEVHGTGYQATHTMREITMKIKTRLTAICDEYEEQIRDCTMRLDGMAIATQWAHSEAAVEITMATNQDAKVMKSISLVTMIFLPGTFFATVFSMTFFDWNDDKGNGRVSSYLWIYIVVTVIFTGITIGLWYFFVVHRRPATCAIDEEVPASYQEKYPKEYTDKKMRAIRMVEQLKRRLCL